jgi:hypothetical protein
MGLFFIAERLEEGQKEITEKVRENASSRPKRRTALSSVAVERPLYLPLLLSLFLVVIPEGDLLLSLPLFLPLPIGIAAMFCSKDLD